MHVALSQCCTRYCFRSTHLAQNQSQRGSAVHHLARAAQRYPPGVSDVGEALLRAPKLMLTAAERRRLDEAPDAEFYSTPRLMTHASPAALEELSRTYARLLTPGMAVLELCASAHSHMPAGLALAEHVGQGMNGSELTANAALSRWFVQDLNAQPLLLEERDGSYDAVLCVSGICYLTQPETVITEVRRLLRPGGLLLLAFGADCFKEKAFAGWLCRSMQERVQLLSSILQANGFGQVQLEQQPQQQQQQQQQQQGVIDDAERLHVLIATKQQASMGSGASSSMRPDNVSVWLDKPALAGLVEAAAAAEASGVGDPDAEALLEQWRGAYDAMASDAHSLGIPRSVLPALPQDADAAQLQAAVQHLRDMVASFMSSGL